MQSLKLSRMQQPLAGRYQVGQKLGKGAFGQIHLGTDVYTGEQVAIKFESVLEMCPQLYFESKLYSYLQGGCNGIPKFRWYGVVGQYYALVLDLLGDSLENLFKRCDRKFSLKTVLMLADQLLNIIEYVHSKSFVHRDIKPDNFMMGRGTWASQVFMIDFGLAKKYKDTVTHEHIPYRDGQELTGTPEFASINAHDGIEITRRDDLESLGYVLMYFLQGRLPWQGAMPSYTTYKYSRMRKRKVSTATEALCRGLPSEFKSYCRYCRELPFDAAPDYVYLKRLFRNLFFRQGYQYDYIFDWTVLNNQQCSLPAVPRPVLASARGKSSLVPYTQYTKVYHSAHKNSLVGCPEYCAYDRCAVTDSKRNKVRRQIKELCCGLY